jgi:hypothetical protein
LVVVYNELHTTTNAVRLDVEAGLRKIRRGGKPWSPKLQQYRDTIELWSCAVKYKLGVKTSRVILTRLAIRLHAYEWAYVDLNTAQERLRDALKVYKTESVNALYWREDHKTELAKARADANGT